MRGRKIEPLFVLIGLALAVAIGFLLGSSEKANDSPPERVQVHFNLEPKGVQAGIIRDVTIFVSIPSGDPYQSIPIGAISAGAAEFVIGSFDPPPTIAVFPDFLIWKLRVDPAGNKVLIHGKARITRASQPFYINAFDLSKDIEFQEGVLR